MYDDKMNKIMGWVAVIFQLINGLGILAIASVDRDPLFGRFCIYVPAVAPLLIGVLAFYMGVMIAINYKKLAKKIRFVLFTLVMCAMLFLWIPYSLDFVKDIANGTVTTETEFFVMNKRLLIYDRVTGENMRLIVNNDQSRWIREHHVAVDREKHIQTANVMVFARDKQLAVEYYPNTGIVKGLEFKE